jgi:hypothetical protein
LLKLKNLVNALTPYRYNIKAKESKISRDDIEELLEEEHAKTGIASVPETKITRIEPKYRDTQCLSIS